MDEVWARVALVAGALAVSGLVVWWQRRRGGHAIRHVPTSDLPEGVYFFSSTACPSCKSARESIVIKLGDDGFTEFVWQEDGGLFDELEILAVPALLVVSADGSGRLFSGQPDLALRSI